MTKSNMTQAHMYLLSPHPDDLGEPRWSDQVGQGASIRPDILPAPYLEEMQKLQVREVAGDVYFSNGRRVTSMHETHD